MSEEESLRERAEVVFRVFVLTDVVGSTALMRDHPEETQAALERHEEIIESAVSSAGGRFLRKKGEGDSTFSVFLSARDATVAIVDALRRLEAEPWREPVVIKIRAGIHAGEAQNRDENYFGSAVNLAARLRAMANPGQVLISSIVKELCDSAPPPPCGWRHLGSHRPRDFGAMDLYQPLADGVSESFPPLAGSIVTPHNLPAPSTSYIEREDEVARISQGLSKGRLVSLTGPSGTGKTRLVVEYAYDVLDQYPDGVFWADLTRAQSANEALTELASAIGIREEPRKSLLDSVCDAIRHRRSLILLDHCEHLLPELQILVDRLISGTRIPKFLSSSQQAFKSPHETVVRIPPLAIPPDGSSGRMIWSSPSVRLFSDRAASSFGPLPSSEHEAVRVGQICRRLDGLPLAIELAAKRTTAIGTQQLLTLLDDRFAVLTDETGSPLRVAMDLTYDQLDESCARALRRLAVFRGGFDLEGARVILASSQTDVQTLDLLQELIDFSLLNSEARAEGDRRYSMLETVRDYARALAIEAGEWSECLALHADLFHKRLYDRSRSSSQPITRHRWFVEEQTNLRQALGTLMERPEATEAAKAVGWLEPFWRYSGELREGHSWAIQVEQRVTDRASVALCRKVAGVMLWKQGLLIEAKQLFATNIQDFAALDDPCQEAIAYNNMGLVAWQQGNRVEARSLFERGLPLARTGSDPECEGNLLENLGIISRELDQLEDAEKYHLEARRVRKGYGDDIRVSETLSNLGMVYERMDRLDLARKVGKQAYDAFLDLNLKQNAAYSLYNLANLARRSGDFEEALRLCDSSREMLAELGDVQALAHVPLLRAHIFRDEAKWEDASREYLLALRDSIAQEYAVVIEEGFDGLALCLVELKMLVDAASALAYRYGLEDADHQDARIDPVSLAAGRKAAAETPASAFVDRLELYF